MRFLCWFCIVGAFLSGVVMSFALIDCDWPRATAYGVAGCLDCLTALALRAMEDRR